MSPQLGGNIAVLSALANPAAGAVVYLAQRLFKKQLNDVIRYDYTVTGSWEDPDISRDKYEPVIPVAELDVGAPDEPLIDTPVQVEAVSGGG